MKVIKSQVDLRDIAGHQLDVVIAPLEKLELTILGERINQNLGSTLGSPLGPKI